MDRQHIDIMRDFIQTQLLGKGITRVTAGFDGFVDTIVNVVRTKGDNNGATLFETIREFGSYVIDKSDASFSVELMCKEVKLGGNMPILANALGRMGVKVNCIGALGYPVTHPAFEAMSPNCTRLGFTNPGITTALEFNDGKIMLGEMDALNTAGWHRLRETIGLDRLIELFSDSDLVCLVNWSEIDVSTEIWTGILDEVVPVYLRKNDRRQLAFIDLSDCSGRSRKSIRSALQLIKRMQDNFNVTLGLNRNECSLVSAALFDDGGSGEMVAMGQRIFESLGLSAIVLHSSREAVGIDTKGVVRMPTIYTEKPVISTGAGDNFNAGYCLARLGALDLKTALMFGNVVSGYYVRHGHSPAPDALDLFLTNLSQQV